MPLTLTNVRQIRASAMVYLREAEPHGMEEPMLRRLIQSEGLPDLTPEEFREQIEFLISRGLVEATPNLLTPAVRRLRVSVAAKSTNNPIP